MVQRVVNGDCREMQMHALIRRAMSLACLFGQPSGDDSEFRSDRGVEVDRIHEYLIAFLNGYFGFKALKLGIVVDIGQLKLGDIHGS